MRAFRRFLVSLTFVVLLAALLHAQNPPSSKITALVGGTLIIKHGQRHK